MNGGDVSGEHVSGAGVVAGRVLDLSGSPVAAATVAVVSSTGPHPDVAALSAADGSFRLGGLGPGQVLVEARHGGATATAEVDIRRGGVVEVELRLG